MILTIDSSVMVKWVNQTNEKDIDKADKIMTHALAGHVELIAPEIARYEVGNVLINKKLQTEQAAIALRTLNMLPILFIPDSEDLANQTFFLARTHGITYYDASFLALAMKHSAELITDNVKHQQKDINGLTVIRLGDYGSKNT